MAGLDEGERIADLQAMLERIAGIASDFQEF